MTDAGDPLVNRFAALSLGVADRVREAVEAASGLSAAAPAGLVALQDMVSGGTVDRLRRVLALTPSGAVRLVDRLVAAGLVQRRPGPDARSLALVLTEAGDRLASQARVARARAVADLLLLDEDEERQLRQITDVLLRRLTEVRLADRSAGRPPESGWLCRLCDMTACRRPQGECPAQATAAGDAEKGDAPRER